MPVTKRDIETAKAIARFYGARRLVLFGRAKDNPSKAHDLDLAVSGIEGWRLWELAAEMEEALSVPLDLVPLEPHTRFTRLIEERGEVLFDA